MKGTSCKIKHLASRFFHWNETLVNLNSTQNSISLFLYKASLTSHQSSRNLERGCHHIGNGNSRHLYWSWKDTVLPELFGWVRLWFEIFK
jgi:hypothetical protein